MKLSQSQGESPAKVVRAGHERGKPYVFMSKFCRELSEYGGDATKAQ